MKYYLDSSDVREVAYAFETFGIEGVTTNPRQLAVIGKKQADVIRDLADWTSGKGFASSEQFPVSIELNPNLTVWKDM